MCPKYNYSIISIILYNKARIIKYNSLVITDHVGEAHRTRRLLDLTRPRRVGGTVRRIAVHAVAVDVDLWGKCTGPLDFTPEIEIFYMLFERSLSIFSVRHLSNSTWNTSISGLNPVGPSSTGLSKNNHSKFREWHGLGIESYLAE